MSASTLTFSKVNAEADDRVAVLAINRPESANAFNAELIDSLVANLKTVADATNCRALILTGRGKHFSAGADLGWMKDSAKLGREENISDAKKLIALFSALDTLPIPTIGVIRGAVFGGAVGLVACCDIAIAAVSAKFCLSEVKLGLLPAVILPHLARKMLPGQLRRHSLSARVFRAEEALAFGLVERVATEEELEDAVREELGQLLQCSAEAQARLKALHKQIVDDSLRQGDHTAEAIAAARTSAAGQAGLSAFFDKKSAPWVRTLGEAWTFEG